MSMKRKLVFLLFTILSLGLNAQEAISATIAHDGEVREYILYVPEMYDDESAFPLMFNFHGYIGRASWHMESTEMAQVADTAGFLLVYPQGSLLNGRTHWNVGSWTIGSTADDIGFTSAMIDTLSAMYNIDLERIYACGFSNGGYFSYELACKLSDRIAAIGSVGGKMSSETFAACSPGHPMPVVSINGTGDDIVNYFNSDPVNSMTVGEVNNYWKTHNNTEDSAAVIDLPNIDSFDGSTVTYFSYADGDSCVSVDHYKVNGGGHDWPGVTGNQDVHASSLIWDFVSQYDINGLISCGNATSSTHSVMEHETILYPNPTSEKLFVNTNVSASTDYRIYTLEGKLVLDGKLKERIHTLDVSILEEGIYFLKIGSTTSKFIKVP